MKNWNTEIQYLGELLPNSKLNFNRLKELLTSTEETKVAVFGKYNHGKSTLLNAVVGYEHFSVADKRETIVVSEIDHDGVTWIDTPGLDADTAGDDDRLAIDAVLQKADILCFVHNVKSGELDKSEMNYFQKLISIENGDPTTFLLVLTQVDQVSPDDMERVKAKVIEQVPDVNVICVSATRYTRGLAESNPAFVNVSGMPLLFKKLDSMKENTGYLRKKEAQKIIKQLRLELKKINSDKDNELNIARESLYQTKTEFKKNLHKAREKYVSYSNQI
ncbi:MAG: Unknown protein [uncultured Thiotrichaceae bacterium]|uniref:G domain-containing protein n=1 Tax=uncultured Thiotrichaceae bacterium TaxID=298394 RepID=A0A6S6TZ83_9GAMM|nr:MAG: Unknown protein [uncultured Thiotrichaceae bacterium]